MGPGYLRAGRGGHGVEGVLEKEVVEETEESIYHASTTLLG